ncbi:MAG: SgcJ/EcaC family oxidoreductase [Solirubrobacteraceae bacterium]|jgi:uncharacterized protein (TIGR02246 family)
MTATELIATEDASAVRAVLNEVYAAWADNDPDAFVARYAADATAVHTGVYMPNRDAIRATIAAMFAGELKGSKGVHEVQSIRFVGADTAIVLSKGAIVIAGQDEAARESRTIDGWVLCRHDAHWRVEAFHNCAESLA